MRVLCQIETAYIEPEFGPLNTTDVVLTEERVHHIQQRHPEDWTFFVQYGIQSIVEPDLVLADTKHANTVMMIRQMPETNLNAVVRLSVAGQDEKGFANSVMTFYRIREVNLLKLQQKHKLLYKK